MRSHSLLESLELVLRHSSCQRRTGRTTEGVRYAANLGRRHSPGDYVLPANGAAYVDYVVLDERQADELRRYTDFPGKILSLEQARRNLGGGRAMIFDHAVVENLLYAARESLIKEINGRGPSPELASARKSIRELKSQISDLKEELERELEDLDDF